MASDKANLKSFLEWEIGAFQAVDASRRALIIKKDLTQRWNQANDGPKDAYIAALRNYLNDLSQVESTRKALARASKESSKRTGGTQVEKRRALTDALNAALTSRQAAATSLGALHHQRNINVNTLIPNESIQHTANLVQNNQDEIEALRQRIQNHRDHRREAGSPVASDAAEEETAGQEDVGDRAGDEENAQAPADAGAEETAGQEDIVDPTGDAQPPTGEEQQGAPAGDTAPPAENENRGSRMQDPTGASSPPKDDARKPSPSNRDGTPKAEGSALRDRDGKPDSPPRDVQTAKRLSRISAVSGARNSANTDGGDGSDIEYLGTQQKSVGGDDSQKRQSKSKKRRSDGDDSGEPPKRRRPATPTTQNVQTPTADAPPAGDVANATFKAKWHELMTWAKEKGTSGPLLARFEIVRDRAIGNVARGGKEYIPLGYKLTGPAGLIDSMEDEVTWAENEKADEEKQPDAEQEKSEQESFSKIQQEWKDNAPGLQPQPEVVPGDWVFMDTLGCGGEAHAGLWAEFDEFGRIKRRIVAKECYPGKEGFEDVSLWHGPVKNRNPREVVVQTTMNRQDNKDDPCGVRLLGSGVYPESSMFRIYLEFCEHGDLYSVANLYFKLEQAHLQYGRPDKAKVHIPSRVMYFFFYTLARFVCLMWHGYLPGGEKPENWTGLLHRDIKHDNIFLSKPSDTSWPSIPRPKVGDFGLAIQAGDNTTAAGTGTTGYRSFEQIRLAGRFLTAAAEVWTVGIVILSLMHHVVGQPEEVEGVVPIIHEEVAKIYDAKFVELVTRCLRASPTDRIEVWDLCEELAKLIGENDISMEFKAPESDEIFLYDQDKYAFWLK